MRKFNHIIYLTGETAQGKTTFGRKLSHYLDGLLISVDTLYEYVYLNGGTEEARDLVYRIAQKVAREIYPTVIIEGTNIGAKEERDFINRIFEPDWFYLLKLESHEWEKRLHKKWLKDKKKEVEEIEANKEWLKDIYAPADYTFIIDDKGFSPATLQKDFMGRDRHQVDSVGGPLRTKQKVYACQMPVDFWTGKSVLDVGCNEAEVYPLLRNLQIRSYSGIDRDWVPIEEGLRKYPGLNIRVADLTKYFVKVDVIVAFGILYHLSDDDLEMVLKKYPENCKHLFVEWPTTKTDKSWWVSNKDGGEIIETLLKYFNRVEVRGDTTDAKDPGDPRGLRKIFYCTNE